MLPTIVIRHRKENLQKCSLRGLENRNDFLFFTYPKEIIEIDFSSYILLTIDAPILQEGENEKGFLLIDATWKYAGKILGKYDTPKLEKKSLPPYFKTAYPRYQTGCSDPNRGLASIEALYIAFLLTKRPTNDLLVNYYWKDQFLKKNELF
jgi:pre-rRNA-processing protein TSR3